MVVVDNARRLIGKTADIAVTSVLQTTAGKMIFGRLWEEKAGSGSDDNNSESNMSVHDSRSLGALRFGGQIRGDFAVAEGLRFRQWRALVASLQPETESVSGSEPA